MNFLSCVPVRPMLHGLKYYTKKSQCIVFASRGKSPPIKLYGSELSRVTQFRYLVNVSVCVSVGSPTEYAGPPVCILDR